MSLAVHHIAGKLRTSLFYQDISSQGIVILLAYLDTRLHHPDRNLLLTASNDINGQLISFEVNLFSLHIPNPSHFFFSWHCNAICAQTRSACLYNSELDSSLITMKYITIASFAKLDAVAKLKRIFYANEQINLKT